MAGQAFALMAQLAEAKQRAQIAQDRRTQLRIERQAMEEKANSEETNSNNLKNENDRYASLIKKSGDDWTATDAERAKNEGRYNYLVGKNADLLKMRQNIDDTTQGKISALQSEQGTADSSSGSSFGGPGAYTPGSSFGPGTTFGQNDAGFSGLRDKVRAGFIADASRPPSPDEIINANKTVRGGR